ncbi:helix-turn-helix domain-containing protein [Pseudomonas aeruginosa]|uniref:helix-turn-helix domain-containing protein n=1 Tax=Pseudomonas aeruginosa TaxID=287 RepID=UPI003F6D20AB
MPDARQIADALQARGVKLALGTNLYDPVDSMGKMFFNVLAAMAIARAKGRLRGKQPKLSDKQQKELRRMHETEQYSISGLAESFSVSRTTVYRPLVRNKGESNDSKIYSRISKTYEKATLLVLC